VASAFPLAPYFFNKIFAILPSAKQSAIPALHPFTLPLCLLVLITLTSIPMKEIVKATYVVCLECGKKLRTLKTHLRSKKTQAAHGKGGGLGQWSQFSATPKTALAADALSSLAAATVASAVAAAPVGAVAVAAGVLVVAVAAVASSVVGAAAPVGAVAVAAQEPVLVPEVGLPGRDPVLVPLAGVVL
jgi:ROS/MUCR transcriptional regulator protein